MTSLRIDLRNGAALECGPSYYSGEPVALDMVRRDSFLRSEGPPVELKATVRLSLIDARDLAAILAFTATNAATPTDAPAIAKGWVEVLPEPEGRVLLLVGPEGLVATGSLSKEDALKAALHLAVLVATDGATADLTRKHSEEAKAAREAAEAKAKAEATVEALVALAAGFKAEEPSPEAPEA